MSGAEPETIQRLFDDVAPTYDLLNRLLSVGSDRRWRRQTAKLLAPRPGGILLDLCGGTGDLSLELQRLHPDHPVLLVDFAEEMLRLALPKLEAGNGRSPLVLSGDACRLPLPDGSCAGVTAAFGFRNLRSVRAGLEEAHRVLRVGGRLAILEFYRPTGVLAPAKALALRAIIPALAWIVSPKRAPAYRYLADSITRFISTEQMCELLRETGFGDVEVHPRLLRIATIIGATRR